MSPSRSPRSRWPRGSAQRGSRCPRTCCSRTSRSPPCARPLSDVSRSCADESLRRRNDTARLGGSRGNGRGGVPPVSDPDLFVSYAQHGEDVILWRALGGRASVFYVDVGAFDPTYDSVTRALYERGWRGINIEPQPDRIQAFEDERPEDLNLNLAIGDQDGTIELILPDNPGWASTLDPTLTGADPSTSQVLVVQLRRLDTLLADLAITHVDVLKIDVEGAEPAVVRGLLGGPVRPRVCVVEGVAPGVGRTFGDEAVALLVDDGYVHCLFDGLNHYLTTDPSLQEALSTPANPLDGFATDLVNRLHAERHENLVTIVALAAENTTLRGLSGTPAAQEAVEATARVSRQLISPRSSWTRPHAWLDDVRCSLVFSATRRTPCRPACWNSLWRTARPARRSPSSTERSLAATLSRKGSPHGPRTARRGCRSSTSRAIWLDPTRRWGNPRSAEHASRPTWRHGAAFGPPWSWGSQDSSRE